MQESMNAGLISMTILLTQLIKNQKWMRQKSLSSLQLPDTTDPLTLHTLDLIEHICHCGQLGLTRTPGRFLDKVGFFSHLAEAVFRDNKQEDLELTQ